MNRTKATCAIAFLALSTIFSCQQDPFDKMEAGKTPRIFYPDNISRNGVQWNNSFTKDGRHIFYTIQGKTGAYLVTQEYQGGTYGDINRIPFDSTAMYSDVTISQKGDYMVFMSTLPDPETGDTDFDLWQSSLNANGWSAPTPVSKATSGPGNEGYPWLVSSGNLYFSVARDGSRNSDIYVLRKGASEAEALSPQINSDKFEGDAFVDAKERFIIFAAFDRPDGLGFSDLYISFQENGSWSTPKNMGINSTGYDGSPFVTADGKYLIFTSSRNSPGNNSYFNHYIVSFDMDDYR